MASPKFTFRVAPHAIEDLGSNLYTSFPRVLAEFVANAYDADATRVDIDLDFHEIKGARKLIRKSHLQDVAEQVGGTELTPLENQFLHEKVAITVRDDGFGMTESDLDERFLWTAKRRRKMKALERSKPGRPLMGRKGLGKLAGFGVAHKMEVVTKRKDKKDAILVTLDYDAILKTEELNAVPVPSAIDSKTFAKREHGTVIRLRRLAYDAVKSRKATIVRELAEHFEFIDRSDFNIYLNGHRIPQPKPEFAFAWPEPTKSVHSLVERELETENGKIEFSYRIRFRKDRRALPAQKRGVRVYSHKRMAAAPSLFDADTNMHGFRMTDYMDGVVEADFIDDQPQDYISTDRQSLRWETPLLTPLRDFLSQEIKEACKQYQKVRDQQKEDEVQDDEFTNALIGNLSISSKERKLVSKIATSLARICKKGTEDPKYRQLLPEVTDAFKHGNMYEKLSELAEDTDPDISELLAQVVRLNRFELDRSTSIVRSRIKAIEALRKEVERATQRKESRNELEIQKLFEEAPWLINPLYHDYLTADKSFGTTLKNLAKELGVLAPDETDYVEVTKRREPDFFFLLGDNPLHYVVIVEIKASNKIAEVDDLNQLRDYMETARQWLSDNGHRNVSVSGELICSPPRKNAKKKEQRYLANEIAKLNAASDHRVRSYTEVLSDAETAHANILEIALATSKEEDSLQAAKRTAGDSSTK